MDLNLLDAEEEKCLRQYIAEAQHIVVCGHKSPDGDALSSCLGWSKFLREQCGKDVTAIIPDAFPDFLKWLPDSHTLVRFDKHPDKVKEAFDKADLIFCLDFAEYERVENMSELLRQAKADIITVDHHISPKIVSALLVSRPGMSSTAEMIFRLIWQLGGFEKMDKALAVQLYCGMMTDTGGFTFNSTRPEIYFIIGQLLSKGIDKDKIYRYVFNNYSQWAIRLRGYIMYQKLNVFEELHASYFTITRQDMQHFHFIKGDAEGLVNEPLRIKGMKLSISMREDDRRDNTIWVSLRSVDDFPCNEMAGLFFNGGGHLNASGGHLNCSMEEAEKVVREAFAHYADRLKG